MNEKPHKRFSERTAGFIVKYRVVFAVVFVLLMIFSVFSSGWVELEENIVQFLPEDAESRIALDIMQREFTSYGLFEVVVEDVSYDEAVLLSGMLSRVYHVSEVRFEPRYDYRARSALFEISTDTVSGTEENTRVMETIRSKLVGYDASLYAATGMIDSDVVTREMTVAIVIFAVILLVVLLLSSDTFGEIPVLLITFGAAALLNIGTHFLFGTISFVSGAVSVLLQLALSLDYAIIFCNRYKEERAHRDAREAAVKALGESIPAILASSLTTVAGLFAMTLMRFRLGADLGMVLIKSILMSLITVFLFMPALLLFFDKLMQHTKHRRLLPGTGAIGRFAVSTRRVIPVIVLILVAAGCFLTNHTKFSYNYVYTSAHNESEGDRALRLAEMRFGRNLFTVIVPAGDYASEKALLDEMNEHPDVVRAYGLANTEVAYGVCLCDEVSCEEICAFAELDEELGQRVFTRYAEAQGENLTPRQIAEEYRVRLMDLFLFLHDECREELAAELPKEQLAMIDALYDELVQGKAQLQSEAYSCLVVDATLPPQGEEVREFSNWIHETARAYYGDELYIYGDSMYYLDFEDSFRTDNVTVSLLSILFVLVILFFTFRSAVMPLLLILTIQGSIWINFSLPLLAGNYVYFACFLIVSAIQMGSNVDYAIVMATRYQEMRKLYDRHEAAKRAIELAFPTVMTSGLMMASAGIAMYLLVSENITSGIGHYMGTGALVTMVLVLFALPQLLMLGDDLVRKTTLSRKSKRHSDSE